MPRFIVDRDIEHATGVQRFAVDADSAAEALEMFRNGEGEFECEQIEVTRLAPITLDDIEMESDDPVDEDDDDEDDGFYDDDDGEYYDDEDDEEDEECDE